MTEPNTDQQGDSEMNFSELAQARRSIRGYDTSQGVSDADLKAIFDDVLLSPSSFNLQHWTFVVVRDEANRKALREAAMGQQQVEHCAAVVVVCGKLDAHEDIDVIYAQVPEDVRERVRGVGGMIYAQNEQMRRDEAVRGSSMAAMSLMYSAKAHGFDTGPMIGFDPGKVGELLRLPDNLIPTMMIVMGRGNEEPYPRGHRHPTSEVVKLETYDGAGL